MIISQTQSPEAASRHLEDNYAQYIEQYHRTHIGAIVDRLNDVVRTEDPLLKATVNYFVSKPGKYFRPLLTLMVCEVTGGRKNDAINYACAVELVHASSLIFDDLPCMDNANIRRGQPCLHKRFGEALAMLTAIYFLSKAFELASRSSDECNNVVSILADAIAKNGMVCGQIHDIAGEGKTDRVREMKTTPLLRVAARLGACAANANERQHVAIANYANGLSLAFQLRDDLLDKEIDLAAQQRAEQIAFKASEEILSTFENSAAAVSLAALAFYAVKRRQ